MNCMVEGGAGIQMPLTARCAQCGYLLQGLAETRCPECGKAFEPWNPATYVTDDLRSQLSALWRRWQPAIVRLGRLGLCIAASWWLYSWADGAWSFLFWIPLIWLIMRRQWVATLAFVIASPFGVLLIARCYDYSMGDLRYVRDRLNWVSTPQGSMKPDTRVRGFDPGCGTRSSNYWLRRSCEDLAVPVMHWVMGPPPGAYTGPYPTFDECQTALKQGGQAQPKSAVERGIIVVGGSRFQLDQHELNRFGYVIELPDPSPVTAALFKQQCLVMRIPRDLKTRLATIYLIDITTCEPFAVYWEIEGQNGN